MITAWEPKIRMRLGAYPSGMSHNDARGVGEASHLNRPSCSPMPAMIRMTRFVAGLINSIESLIGRRRTAIELGNVIGLCRVRGWVGEIILTGTYVAWPKACSSG